MWPAKIEYRWAAGSAIEDENRRILVPIERFLRRAGDVRRSPVSMPAVPIGKGDVSDFQPDSMEKNSSILGDKY